MNGTVLLVLWLACAHGPLEHALPGEYLAAARLNSLEALPLLLLLCFERPIFPTGDVLMMISVSQSELCIHALFQARVTPVSMALEHRGKWRR